MLFKGTATRSALEIGEAIDDIGGYVNGLTDREEMHLYARTSSQHAGRALDLLFDLLLHSRAGNEDVAREREVVLQEIAHVHDSSEDWVHELVPQTVWPDHPLGRPVMGSEGSVRRIDRSSLRNHLSQEVHVGTRLIVTAAGRVDHGEIATLTEAHATGLPSSAPELAVCPPAFRSEQMVLARPGTQVQLCLVCPGIARTDDARYAFAVLDTILGGGNSSRLFREIREKRGMAYNIGSYLQSYEAAGLFVVTAGTSPANFRTVLDLIEEEMRRLRADGPSNDEVARAKIQLRVALALAAESTGFRMQHAALSEIYWGRVISFDEIAAGVERVTAEDVHTLARRVLGDGERAMVAIGPVEGEGG
jgi:predicted Zn-dependent peptidase